MGGQGFGNVFEIYITLNTINLQTNKTHPITKTNNRHWTFSALKIHDE
jgi:hypothetical protein